VLEIIDEAFVYLVNGDNRRVDNPKRKNVKHLQFYPAVAEQLALKWEAGQHVGNVEVRKVIAGLVEKWEADQLTPLAAQQKGVEE
jgi:ribosomal protein L14E/L6E/L27E